ncbi:trafficking regulator of GLUT4 1 [Lepisosteus oculatus]|uniref:trafficking regulator of GLUT4 1 n=1 Tax=Lepisosteus oculatus TaxID=7918 RepID=UPI00074025C9|nr:PREDICTED: tumor suppressor candidate 5 [Lepisosteus oculatus]
MAINTDAQFEKTMLNESGTALPSDSQETEKLLSTAATAEPAEENGVKLSHSFTVNIAGDKPQDAVQNGHSAPLRSGSAGQIGGAPLSPSRISLSRASSTGNTAQDQSKPRDYLFLAILSCFCLACPVNLIALVYSIMSRNTLQHGDVDGARRLGRVARTLSIISIVLGIFVVTIYAVVTALG